MHEFLKRYLYKKRALCSLFVFLTAVLYCVNLTAQIASTDHINAVQDSLKPYCKIILDINKTEEERVSANNRFKTILKRCLEKEGAENFIFDSIPLLAQLKPEDKSFVLYNWEMPHADGTFTFFGFILHKNNKFKRYQLVELTDASSTIKRPETAVLKADNWYGAHYYKIITVKRKGKSYYCLLGADWNDRLSKKKLLEVLSFEKDGTVKFGAPIINYNKIILNRLIFEYSSKISMSLNYNENSKLIIFDHLSPIEENLKGQYQFYAPDLSYDALKFKKGKWQHIENIDARNIK